MSTIYKCLTCGDKTEFSYKKMKEHLTLIHNIKELKSTKKAIMFMDGSGYRIATSKIKIGNIELYEEIYNEK